MGAKIIIVDDEQNVVRWLSYALQAQGYEVETAENGQKGLEKILAEPPDLVILDVMMPDMSGTDVCEQLRANPATIALPVIMLSGKAQVPDKIKGLQSGADEYLTKPFETDEVVARIEALLKRTQQVRNAPSVKHGKVLGFIGAKGGVGTTTVALNIALALIQRKEKVIAAELRPYFGTAALQLGLHGSRTQLGLRASQTLSDLLELEPQDMDERQLRRRLTTHSSGLDILLGPQGVETAKDMQPDQVEAIIIGLSGMAEYTILDIPSYPSPMNRAVLQRCDSISMVLDNDPTSLESGKVTLDLLQSWDIEREGVGAVMVQRGEATAMALSDVTSQLGCEVIGTMTRASELSLLALKQGAPIVLSSPDSLAADTLTELAERLVTDKAMAMA